MNLKLIRLCSGMVTLLIGMATCVSARGLGPNPPVFGDYKTACNYVVLGNAALAKGYLAEADNDYHKALEASPFDEDATLGLARCAVAKGNYQDAVTQYHKVIVYNEDDIDLMSEYILALQQAGQIPEAVQYYNNALNLCKKGVSVVPMDIYPTTFREDGSDYDPIEMAAMTHLMRALNSSCDDQQRKSAEMEKALDLAPQ